MPDTNYKNTDIVFHIKELFKKIRDVYENRNTRFLSEIIESGFRALLYNYFVIADTDRIQVFSLSHTEIITTTLNILYRPVVCTRVYRI